MKCEDELEHVLFSKNCPGNDNNVPKANSSGVRPRSSLIMILTEKNIKGKLSI